MGRSEAMQMENNHHHHSHNSSGNNIKWGTWEELILGSAVKRHGINNWEAVSLEIQARKLSPYIFSSEDCKAKYDALQGRFGKTHSNNNNTCSNNIPWLEELRKLRVAQLRRELERYDGSIISLETKVKKLKAERAQSLAIREQKTIERSSSQQESKADPKEKEEPVVQNSAKEGSRDGSCAACIYPKPPPNALGMEGLCLESSKCVKIEASDDQGRPSNQPDPARSSRSGNNQVAPAEDLASKDPLAIHERLHDRDPQRERDLSSERAQPALVSPQLEGSLHKEKGLPDVKKGDETREGKPKSEVGPSSPLDSYYGSSETIARERPHHVGSEAEDLLVESTDVHSETSRPKDEGTSAPSAMKGREFQEGSAESREIGEEEEEDDDDDDDKETCEKLGDRREGLQPWDTSDVLSSAELSTRRRDGRKSSSTSHEGSGNAQGHYKDCEDSMGGWHQHHQATRSSGDSHIEGTDEMSPMSKRSRREARVSGKLLPLLECLRSISAHKFGPVFKHRLESQDNLYYRSLIRRHMDLGMVRSRLEEGAYSGSLEFFRDMLLVFNNALVYYPKYSQEYVAAYVLRELASKEMTNIFQTEAMLKQEGPSTRKREPRRASELAMAVKPNPNPIIVCRKRNASSAVGEKPLGRPKSARMTWEQTSAGAIHMEQQQRPEAEEEKQNEKKNDNTRDKEIETMKTEELKDRVEASLSASVAPDPEVQPDMKNEFTKAIPMDNSMVNSVTEQSKPETLALELKSKNRNAQNAVEPTKTSCCNNHLPKNSISDSHIDLKKGSTSSIDLRRSSIDVLESKKRSSHILEQKKNSSSIIQPKNPGNISEQKRSYSDITEPKIFSNIVNQKKSSSNIVEPRKNFSNVVGPTKSSSNIVETKKNSSNNTEPVKGSSSIAEQRRSSNNIGKGSREVKKEQDGNLLSKPSPKQALSAPAPTTTAQEQPPVKRGVGRPPKHAHKAVQNQQTQQSAPKQQAPVPKAMNAELPSKQRKRSRK